MNKLVVSLLTLSALTLSACESTKEQFDFSKKAPDEFAVVKRAPLAMPPSYELTAPKPGAPRPQEQSMDQVAKEAILGPDALKASAKANGVSEGEAVLLNKTGAANVNPAIRAKVDAETAEIIKDETPGIDTLKKMVGQKPSEPAPELIDPVKETLRIKENKAKGKPISEGKTPKKSDDD